MGEGILGVVVGGLIAIIGTIATPIVQHFLGKKDRDELAKKAAIQAVISALYELDVWLENYRKRTAFGEKIEPAPSPQALIEATILVTFPDTEKELRTLNVAIAAHNQWCTRRFEERVKGKAYDLANWGEITGSLTSAKGNVIASLLGKPRVVYDVKTDEFLGEATKG